MASENDTVAEIGERMRKVDPTAFVVWWDQLAAAHNRELAAKDDERLTIVAIYENVVIAAKDAKIAELRECLKVAEDALEKIDNMCDGDMCKHFDNTHHCSACRYLNECQTGVAHAALREIHEKGANDETK